jgi:hypothetical protein
LNNVFTIKNKVNGIKKFKNSKELGCVFHNGRKNQQLKFNDFFFKFFALKIKEILNFNWSFIVVPSLAFKYQIIILLLKIHFGQLLW